MPTVSESSKTQPARPFSEGIAHLFLLLWLIKQPLFYFVTQSRLRFHRPR
ncbi:MAG: hypothetical protein LBK82_08125 [Planctomycetaceae bacterium]|nr:hypothetical protein [Planctomycetaceae bacterium]